MTRIFTPMAFIKTRSEAFSSMLRYHPKAFLLLSWIAHRSECGDRTGLEPGQAKIGDFSACGLNRQEYRTALNHLIETGFVVTTKVTTNSKVVSIYSSDIYDMSGKYIQPASQPLANHQGNHQGNQQTTTGTTTKVTSKNEAKSQFSNQQDNQQDNHDLTTNPTTNPTTRIEVLELRRVKENTDTPIGPQKDSEGDLFGEPIREDARSAMQEKSLARTEEQEAHAKGNGELPKTKRISFKEPTQDEVMARCVEMGYMNVNPVQFITHYGSNGWKVGKNKMVSWQMALGGWESRAKEKS